MCMDVYHVHAWCPWRSKEVIGFLELEFQIVVSHHVGAGNQTLGPLKEQWVLLSTESSPKPPSGFIFNCMCVWLCACDCNSPRRSEEGIRSPGVWVTHISAPAVQHQCWEQNLGPLQKQYTLYCWVTTYFVFWDRVASPGWLQTSCNAGDISDLPVSPPSQNYRHLSPHLFYVMLSIKPRAL